jgi:uncharacterized membrane protein
MPRFALTIFLSAFLLFQVQPLMGRYVLPWFGGGPAVWSTCMLFFQVLLLGGYGYAHLLGTRVPPRRQPWVHAAVVLTTLPWLPVGVSEAWKPRGSEAPAFRIVAMLAVGVAGPYLVLSSTGPLLQSWFRIAQPLRSPYRLYALSNLGSLLALLSYPFVFEPWLTRREQAAAWSTAYILFIAGVLACGRSLARARPGDPAPQASPGQEPSTDRSPRAGDHARWALLGALGSINLLATTNQLCLDVAVVPFLWVLPLALYLATFILSFDHDRWYSPGWTALLLSAAVGWSAWVLQQGVDATLASQLGSYAAAMFLACLACHGQLARTKPHPRHLTGFFFSMSAGGALGGAFVALLAPVAFLGHYEFPLGLLGALAVAALAAARDRRWSLARIDPLLGAALATLCALLAATPLLHGVLTRSPGGGAQRGETLEVRRNFYGVLRVLKVTAAIDDQLVERLELEHGRITHGDQYLSPSLRTTPTTYYGHGSGAGLAIRHHPRRNLAPSSDPFHLGVIGLGTGTLAAYGEKGELVRFYEINPLVPELAQRHFSYLRDCPAQVHIALGDARITLESELRERQPQGFDVLAIDAFSGDAIPVHLLTRECARLYAAHLRPGGVLAVHISNRYIDLRPVALGLAKAMGREAVLIESDSDPLTGADAAGWVLITDNRDFLDSPIVKASITPWGSDTPAIEWTDDFSSVWTLLDAY